MSKCVPQGCYEALLCMNEILHRFESMERHYLLAFTGDRPIPGVLNAGRAFCFCFRQPRHRERRRFLRTAIRGRSTSRRTSPSTPTAGFWPSEHLGRCGGCWVAGWLVNRQPPLPAAQNAPPHVRTPPPEKRETRKKRKEKKQTHAAIPST